MFVSNPGLPGFVVLTKTNKLNLNGVLYYTERECALSGSELKVARVDNLD
jgi:hypothetical protein